MDKEIISIFKKTEKSETESFLLKSSSSSESRKPVVIIRRKQHLALIVDKSPCGARSPYSYQELAAAVNDIPKKDVDGFVLVAQLGKYLEFKTGKILPPGIKLKDLLNLYKSYFETKELPAYSVRLSEAGKKLLAEGK